MEDKIVKIDDVSRIILYGVMKQTNGEVLHGINYEAFRHAVRNCIASLPSFVLLPYANEVSDAFTASRKPKKVSMHFTDVLCIASFDSGEVETIKINESCHSLVLDIVEKFDDLAEQIEAGTLNIARRIAMSLDKYTPISNMEEYEIKPAADSPSKAFVQFQNEQGAILIDYVNGRRYVCIYKLGLFEIKYGFKRADRFPDIFNKKIDW